MEYILENDAYFSPATLLSGVCDSLSTVNIKKQQYLDQNYCIKLS